MWRYGTIGTCMGSRWRERAGMDLDKILDLCLLFGCEPG